MQVMLFLSFILLTFAHGLAYAESPSSTREIVLTAHMNRTDVRDYVMVRYNPLRTSFLIPQGAFLEYEMWQHPDNVTFRGGVELMTERGRFTNQEIPDQNGVLPYQDIDLARFTRNNWYKRRFSLKAFEGYTISEISLTVTCGNIPRKGVNETRYRRIRLVDEKGTLLTDFSPLPGWLPYPLIVSENYTPDVRASIDAIVSASFDSDFWLISNTQGMNAQLFLKNYDSVQTLPVTYSLELVSLATPQQRLSLSAGSLKLAPQEIQKLPCRIDPLSVGHWRPEMTLHCGEQTSHISFDAISVLTSDELNSRKRPFTPGGFGMGAVALSGDGTAAALPGLREQGANYYQIRLSWSQIETEPGQYDFSRIRKILEVARRCGMWVQIDLYSGWPDFSVPSWYRDELMHTNAGKIDGRNHAPIGYWSVGRQAGLKVMRAMMEEFQSDPAVIAWNAWTGGDMDSYYGSLDREVVRRRELNDYSPASQAKFRMYVRDIMNLSLAQVAQRYGLPLREWDDLQQPQPQPEQIDLRPIWNDFMNYRLWSVSQAQLEATSLIRAKNPNVTHEYILGGPLTTFRQGNDYDLAILHASATRGSVHQTASPSSTDQAYLGTAQRTAGTMFSIETAACPAPVHMHQHAVYQLASQGASAYTWIQSSGVMPIPSASHGYGEYRPVFERISGATRAGKSIGVVMPYSAQLVDFFGRLPLTPSRVIGELTDHLENANLNFDIYSDRRDTVDWSHYPIVIDGFSFAMESKTADALAQYVHAGGKLVLFTRTGQYTPGNPDTRFALLKKLGCQMPDQPDEQAGSVEMTLLEPNGISRKSATPNLAQAGDMTKKNPNSSAAKMSLRFWQSIGKLPDGARILAQTSQGQPALASWNIGKGTVYLWAGWPDFERTSESTSSSSVGSASIFDQLLQQWAGISPNIGEVPTRVLTTVLCKGSDQFLILLNKSARHQTLRIPLQKLTTQPVHAFELVTRVPLDVSESREIALQLAPWDVKVVQLSPDAIEMPLLDFPARVREIPAPKNALNSTQLLKSMIAPAYGAVDVSGNLVIPSGTEFSIAMPSNGSYTAVSSWNSSDRISMIQDNKEITPLVTSSPTISMLGPVTAKNELSRFRIVSSSGKPITIRWIAFEPQWEPVAHVWGSPVFENSGQFPGKNFNAVLPPEKKVQSSQNWTALTEKWNPLQAENGCIELTQTGGERGIIYVAWQQQSPSAQSSLLSIGADYGIKLWHNGREILNSTAKSRAGAAVEDEFLVPVQLQQGTNIFVAKVAAGTQGWRLWAKQIEQKSGY